MREVLTGRIRSQMGKGARAVATVSASQAGKAASTVGRLSRLRPGKKGATAATTVEWSTLTACH